MGRHRGFWQGGRLSLHARYASCASSCVHSSNPLSLEFLQIRRSPEESSKIITAATAAAAATLKSEVDDDEDDGGGGGDVDDRV